MRILYPFLLLLLPLWAAAQPTPFCTGTTNGFVVDFAEYQGELYATGFFTKICNQTTGYVARWNGAQWQQGAQGGIDEGHALEVIGDALLIATYEFGVDTNYIVRWNGTTLSSLGAVYRTNPNPNQSLTASVYDIIEYGGGIVVCGEFNRVDGQPMSGIARWNGQQWDTLGSGLSGSFAGGPAILYPHQMTVFDGDLIVCGNFLKAGGQTVNGIARWDGQQWHPLGEGFNSTVYGLGVFNGQLYAGGAFTASGATPLECLARWNGSAWEYPGYGFQHSIAGVQPFVHTLRQIGDSLFVAGGFNRVSLESGDLLTGSGVVAINSAGQINLLGGGTPNRDIEAVIPYDGGVLLGGGGNTGSGYVGFWNPQTSALEDLSDADAPKVRPNPARDRIDVSDWTGRGYRSLRLIDLRGQTLLETALEPATGELVLPDLPAGLYALQFDGSRQYGRGHCLISVLPNK